MWGEVQDRVHKGLRAPTIIFGILIDVCAKFMYYVGVERREKHECATRTSDLKCGPSSART
jgi:hypothetical protein